MCILTCAHRGARPATRTPASCTHLRELYETPTRYTRCAYFNDLINCRLANMCSGPIDFHAPRQKSSPTYYANVCLCPRCVQFVSFFSTFLFFFFFFLSFLFFFFFFFCFLFLCLTQWKLFARDVIILTILETLESFIQWIL